jgi:hypothetical protein
MTYNSDPEGASRQKRHRLDRIEATLEAISYRVDSQLL